MGIINSRISSSQHITNKTWLSSVTQVLDLPATAGLVLAHGPHLWPSTGTDPSCAAGEHLINGLCKKKRTAEADSEADAYYGYGGYGLGYGGYGYGGLGYGYGKRSADAEPEADAWYGGYGLGLWGKS